MVDKVLGAKVRIEVNEEGSYEGYVHNIDEKTNKLTLVKVISCTTGTRLHGLHHFFPKEITNLTVLEGKKDEIQLRAEENPKEKLNKFDNSFTNDKPDEKQEVHHKNDNVVPIAWRPENNQSLDNRPLVKRRRNISQKVFQKGIPKRRDPSDEGARLLQRKSLNHSKYNPEMFMDSSDNKENVTINPPDVVVIDSFGVLFEEAVAYISRQRVVGVAWEGVKVGRFGNLCLIQIGCNKCVYIFDIVSLGDRSFDCGLADIMDSGDILKVIHNCRHLSDALYHQYGVSLVNVFDTQVADVIIYRNEMDRELPRQTSSLISSLYEYLDVSPDEYHFYKTRLKHTTNDELVWKNRPLPADLIDAAAKTVMYLRELRLAQMERMMEEFIFGVDIYLSCVRDASDEVVRKKYSSTALPEMFKKLHKGRDRPRYRQLDPELEENNDRDDLRQAWQDGHNFLEKYEKLGMRVREHRYSPLENEQFSDVPPLLNESSSNDLSSAASKLFISEEPRTCQPSGQYSTERTPNFSSDNTRNIGRWSARRGIFSQDDFPQLSSDSDSNSLSGREDITGNVELPKTNTRNPRMGRGRASALARKAELPQARLPRSTHPGLLTSIGRSRIGHVGRLQFPTDDELLNVPEVLSASSVAGIPGGTRVRISRQ